MSILITAATSKEMQAYIHTEKEQDQVGKQICCLVTGVGPVETTLSLAGLLQRQPTIDCVINFGIAGAYRENNTSVQAGLLDLCLAEQEFFGDLGIQFADTVEPLPEDLSVYNHFVLDSRLLSTAKQLLRDAGPGYSYTQGIFVTVSCASGTLHRGNQLGRQFHGLCENMEGAAVARVCQEFSLPCLEIRCISNMVEDRDQAKWQLQEACTQVGKAVATIAAGFVANLPDLI
ncbi:MAG: futalosine hydrolase [Candidatus Electrothrix sp. AS4_5]|nr:futalosine hydrolase [Candidatus Electrothrix gigas]